MLALLQINNNYQYSMEDDNKLSINVSNVFHQKIEPPILQLEDTNAQIEMMIGLNFLDEPLPLPLYQSIKEVLIPLGADQVGLDIKPKILLAIENEFLYSCLQESLIKSKQLTFSQCVETIKRINKSSLFDDQDSQRYDMKKMNEVFKLAIEQLVLTITSTLDVKLINLNSTEFSDIRDSFKTVVDKSYNNSDISKISMSVNNAQELSDSVSKLDGEAQVRKMGDAQREWVLQAYNKLLENDEVMMYGGFNKGQVLSSLINEAEVYSASTIQ